MDARALWQRARAGALALGLAACGADVAPAPCAAVAPQALFGGATPGPDAGFDPAGVWPVGALLGADGALCSGTLVQPGWVLSAAHCDAEDTRFAPGGSTEQAYEVVARHAHPSRDVALLRLAYDVPDVAPVAPVRRAPAAGWPGESVTLAGVGLTEQGALGEVRVLRERVVAEEPDVLVVQGEGAQGACIGDSGGPLLWRDEAGELRLAGILSGGSSRCVGQDRYERVDRLDAWLSAILQPGAPSGTSRCTDSEQAVQRE